MSLATSSLSIVITISFHIIFYKLKVINKVIGVTHNSVTREALANLSSSFMVPKEQVLQFLEIERSVAR
jgi:hypothetical protein